MHHGSSPQGCQGRTTPHTGMHWSIPIPTSNIRLLCLTYTFSPFIRLIRLFWKKWRREGKVRDTVVTGTNAILHAVGTVTEREHAEDTWTRHTNNGLSHTGLGVRCIFGCLPVPWSLRLPPGPTASIEKEQEIKTYQGIHAKVEDLWSPHNTHWLWALQFSRTQVQCSLRQQVERSHTGEDSLRTKRRRAPCSVVWEADACALERGREGLAGCPYHTLAKILESGSWEVSSQFLRMAIVTG